MGSDEIEQMNDENYIEDFTDRVNDYDPNQQYIQDDNGTPQIEIAKNIDGGTTLRTYRQNST